MSKESGWFWLSFSLNGTSQGVCNVQAESSTEALAKAERLGIVPDYDDVEPIPMDEAELPADTLFSRQQMIDRDYESVKSCASCAKSRRESDESQR